MKPAVCHPERRHLAKGLCHACYNKTPRRIAAIKNSKDKYYNKKATCHPERRLKSRGMCWSCWHEFRASEEYIKGYTKLGPNDPCIRGHIGFRRRVTSGGTICTKCRSLSLTQKYGSVLRLYGVDKGTFDAALEAQNGKCVVCKQSPKKSLHVDHCHSCGKFRALLCDKCNRGIGFLGDDVDVLRSAVAHLETHVHS